MSVPSETGSATRNAGWLSRAAARMERPGIMELWTPRSDDA